MKTIISIVLLAGSFSAFFIFCSLAEDSLHDLVEAIDKLEGSGR